MDYGYNNQYSTTSYGAQGGAGGGGFMAGGNQNSPQSANKGYGKDTLRPVTIKQLVDASQPNPDAEFRIDGVEVTQVTFIGQIRNISTQTTNITYKLDDGTGTIEVKQWIDSDAANPDNADGRPGKPALVENAYARVWGRLKAFNNKRHIGAHVIRPITDYNEISYHLLEATVVHLHFTRGPPSGAKGGGNDAGADGGQRQTAGNGGGDANLSGCSAKARQVFKVLQTSPQSNEGLHMQDIAVRLGMDVADVGKAGDELLSQGVIYTTVDDHTWAILNF